MKKAVLLICLALAATVPQIFAQGGVPLWTNRYDANGDDYATAIAVGANGNIFVTGYSTNSGTRFDFATVAYSSAGAALWTNRYDGPGSSDDKAKAIAVGANGHVYVTGYSHSSGIGFDYVTVAYSSAGVAMWTNRYDANGDDYATAIAVGTNGNVHVTGYSAGSTSGYDYATIAYSSTGAPLWTNRYNGSGNGNDLGQAITVGANGNIYVTGESYSSSSGYDYATIAYSGSGARLWTNLYDVYVSGDDSAKAIAVATNGNVYVTGFFYGGGGDDYATIAYSGAGGLLWARYYHGPAIGDNIGKAIAVTGSGNVYVTGQSSGSGNGDDYATIAYSGAGAPLWTNRYDGTADSQDEANALAVDSGGNVYVTGSSAESASGNDYATLAYSEAGTLLWTNRYNGSANGDDGATAIAVDGSGNVLVTGNSWNGSNYDFVTIKYSSGLPPPAHLDFKLKGNRLLLSWTNAGFTLQSAPAVTAAFTNISGATSPFTNPISGPQQFFRLISN